MRTVEVQANRVWPRVIESAPDERVVAGYATRVFSWIALRVASNLITSLFGLILLGAVFVGQFTEIYESLSVTNPIAVVMTWMIEVRWMMRRVFEDWLPWLGQAIHYNTYSTIDWHLLVIFIVYWWVRRVFAFGLATAAARMLRPLLGRRFRLTFMPDAVFIHRRLSTLKLNRLDLAQEGVSFRVVDRSHLPGLLGWLNRLGWLRPSPDMPCPVVMAVCGRRMIPIAAPPHTIEAQRIVESCLLALSQTRI